ncbi:MAG: hypothetical protein ISR83_09010 [Candidatus Marinimicrobia bacterium]|nr:hypothetical protein [Candidatus Neomarinimicrobiota bacterium]
MTEHKTIRPQITKKHKDALNFILDEYFKAGFGALNKTDIDLIFINVLKKYGDERTPIEYQMINWHPKLVEEKWPQKVAEGIMHWACYQNILHYTSIPEGAIVYALQPLIKKYTKSHVVYNDLYPPQISSLFRKKTKKLYADLAIYDNTNKDNLYSIIEVKIVTKKDNVSKENILIDICRLALFNHKMKKPAYFLIFGRKTNVKKLMVKSQNMYPKMLPAIGIIEKNDPEKKLNQRVNRIKINKLIGPFPNELSKYLEIIKVKNKINDICVTRKSYRPGSDGLAAYLFRIDLS